MRRAILRKRRKRPGAEARRVIKIPVGPIPGDGKGETLKEFRERLNRLREQKDGQ
jgi:hypothetical protein